MGARTAVALLWVAPVLLSGQASAQSLNPGPPGPFVVDVRGVSSGVPGGDAFFPSLEVGTTVPTRGFGGSLGAHLYALHLGPVRFGAGVDVMLARGSTPDASSRLTTVAPQISLNFGTSDGWSYLSAGVGTARISLDPGGDTNVSAINFGGGARWFLGAHLGLGFDLRFHRLAAGSIGGVDTPRTTAVAVAVGLSLK